jgi:flavin reductase (DIM6/NTAB) family NADH-FMN oxidoreductase RutF
MNSSSPSAILRPEEFRKACARYATGVAVATVTSPDGSPEGLTVNSFTSVSLEPPLILVCIAKTATAYLSFQVAKAFVVNVLREDQIDLSQHFASSKSLRFDGVAWRSGVHGAPVLDGALAVLECAMHDSFDAGDHTVFIGLVERVESHEGPPLLYFASAYRKLG